MKKIITSVAALGGLALTLGGCRDNGSGTATQPFQTPVPIQTTTPQSYTQIERLSRPAVKEVFERFVDHQVSNATEPYNDPTLQAQIKSFEDTVRPPVGSTDYGAALAATLYPDEYTVNLASTAPAPSTGYFLSEVISPSNFGGRAPNDDVINLELGVLFGHTLSALKVLPEDNEENDCLSKENITNSPALATTATFPYLAGPH